MLNLFALPGNWLAVAMVGLYVWLGPDQGRWGIGYVTAGCVFGLALLGEILEFVAGALGATRAGASRRSTLYAVLGSVVGAIVGGIAGLPIPVIGSLLAALLFGAAGATAGAMYGEWSDGKSWQESWTVGHAAFWGRLFGTLGKFAAGAVMVVVITVAVFF
jgi:uncharacterized protein YqgC (DUF456 family)